MKHRIVVAGSTNTDMVIQAGRFPLPGETLEGSNFFMNSGGKGANQAVAAARLGASVIFIAKTGNDAFGKQNLARLESEGVNTSYVIFDDAHPSGIAFILVDPQGQTSKVVASGANASLLPGDFHDCHAIIEETSILLLQLEIPAETGEYLAALAQERSCRVILSASPMKPVSPRLLANTWLLVAGPIEAGFLSNCQVIDIVSAGLAAEKIKKTGVNHVVILLDNLDVLLLHENVQHIFKAPPLAILDRTAAADVFSAALATALGEPKSLMDACEFAIRAAAISVSRLGAIQSAPFRLEVENAIFRP